MEALEMIVTLLKHFLFCMPAKSGEDGASYGAQHCLPYVAPYAAPIGAPEGATDSTPFGAPHGAHVMHRRTIC